MYKSQLAGLIIDCQADDIDQAAAFWSDTLGLEAEADPGANESEYRHLETGPEKMHIEVQKVNPQRANFDKTTNIWD